MEKERKETLEEEGEEEEKSGREASIRAVPVADLTRDENAILVDCTTKKKPKNTPSFFFFFYFLVLSQQP